MNGSLRIALMKNPQGGWEPDQGDHHLNSEIEPDEWETLFFEVLDMPDWDTGRGDEDIQSYHERQKQNFQKAASARGYEMLGRMWDIYEDVIYLPADVSELRKESSRLEEMTDDAKALRAVKKILFACDEAQRINSGIRLISD